MKSKLNKGSDSPNYKGGNGLFRTPAIVGLAAGIAAMVAALIFNVSPAGAAPAPPTQVSPAPAVKSSTNCVFTVSVATVTGVDAVGSVDGAPLLPTHSLTVLQGQSWEFDQSPQPGYVFAGATPDVQTGSFPTDPACVPPVASFTSSTTHLTASLDASGTTGGIPLTFTWDFGDGATATGVNNAGKTESHTYSAAGTYHVTLTVTNFSTTSSTVTHDVTVVSAPSTSPTSPTSTPPSSGSTTPTTGGSSSSTHTVPPVSVSPTQSAIVVGNNGGGNTAGPAAETAVNGTSKTSLLAVLLLLAAGMVFAGGLVSGGLVVIRRNRGASHT